MRLPLIRACAVVGIAATAAGCSLLRPSGGAPTPQAAPVTVTVTPSGAPSPAPTSTPAARPGWADVVDSVGPAVVRLDVASCDNRWMGTGFVVGRHQIMTAAHVALHAQAISVQGEGFVTTAQPVGLDKRADAALLYTRDALPDAVTVSRSAADIGTPLLLLGFPEAVSDLRATQGIVSGLSAQADYPDVDMHLHDLIATDAAINGGNSGGPAVDSAGQVVGLVTGKDVWDVDANGAISAPVEGTGYLVPTTQWASDLSSWRHQVPSDQGIGCPGDEDPGDEGDVSLAVSVRPSGTTASDIARSLALHGQSINSGQYDIAWSVFTPEMQHRIGRFSAWSAGLETSYWESLDVRFIHANGDAATAEVSLRTRQDARFGHDHQTCSDWAITYGMVRSGGGWLIGRANAASGSPTSC
jgi:serine protease Do